MNWFESLEDASRRGTIPVRGLERRSHPGLLGLRFWDVGAGESIRDAALSVWATSARKKRVDAIRNRSGVWHFPKLPDVNESRASELFEADLSIATLARPFTIGVSETGTHFQPVAFDVLAPIDGGLFDWPFGGGPERGSPPQPRAVPLFSSASRAAPAGRLTVRADLWDVTGDRPAAWAVLEITVPGAAGEEVFLGVSDERGSVVVFLPVPFVPVDGSRLPASARTWNAGVRVSYAPALALDELVGSPPSAPALPHLDAILAQRSALPATAFAARAPDVVLTSATLTLLEPLILRTEGPLTPSLKSHLLVRPAP